MGITNLATVMVAISLGWLPLSCSKTKPANQAHASASASQTAHTTNSKNLGELTLTNHIETCVKLSADKSCTITPTLLDKKNLKLVMALESKKNGQTAGLNVVQVVTRPGQSLDIAVGDLDITMTPQLAAE